MSLQPGGLRILMTTDAVGGVWVFATALARELCRHGERVTLVTMGPPPKPHHLRAVEGIDGLDLELTELALEWMDPQGDDRARAVRRLRAIERRVAPDLVHLNSYREACAGWTAPVVLTAHSCVRSWWQACIGGEPEEERWCRYVADVAAGLVAADLWTAPTVTFRDTIQTLYAPPTKGRAILNGSTSPDQHAGKEPFILAAGRMWDEAKNLSALTAIAPRLQWPVRVAGPLQGGGAPDRRLDGTRVEALGELSQAALLATMRRAAIFVAPSRYEPFGLSVLEAAAAGCALVLSDIPTFRELWDGAACFVDSADPTALRAALELLSRDAPRREALQRAAARRARRYSLDRMVAAYRAAYAELAGPRASSARAKPRSAEVAA